MIKNKIFKTDIITSKTRKLDLVERTYIYNYKCPKCDKKLTLKEEGVSQYYNPKTMEELTIPCSSNCCDGTMRIVYEEDKEYEARVFGIKLLDRSMAYLIKTGFLKEKDIEDINKILEKALFHTIDEVEYKTKHTY